MSLRSRLALAFTVIAIVPLALLPRAVRSVRATLTAELEQRIDGAMGAAETSLSRTRDEVVRTIDELSTSLAIEEIAQAVASGKHGDTVTVAGAASRLLQSRGLHVLAILDERAATLSSGHLPARLGDRDLELFSVTEAGPDPVPAFVELRDERGIRRAPALVTARKVEYGDAALWLIGGLLVDQGLSNHLAKLTGAQVEVMAREETLARSGEAEPPVLQRMLRLDHGPNEPGVHLRLSFSQAPSLRAEAAVTRAFVGAIAVGLLLSMVLGFLISRRITRPVEALTRAARRVQKGEMRFNVEERASGEVLELVDAFNTMTRALVVAQEQLVASERIAAWQEVARRLAHEIKNPLTPIRMSLETLLAAKKTESPKFNQLFEEGAVAVLEEVDRLRRIVDEFTRFARLPKPNTQPLDASELVTQVAAFAKPQPPVSFSVQTEPGLHVRADKDQLTQVLLNLLKNSEEAMAGKGQLTVRARRAEAEVRIEVEDTGPGIPPELRPRLFEPYFTTKEGGTGLGLAIAARICQEHGGRLEVGGEVGRGAIFTVVLPAL